MPSITDLFSKKKKTDTNNQQQQVKQEQEQFSKGLTSIQDIIAPPSIEVDFSHLKIGESLYKTLFVSGYPRFVDAN